MSPETKEVLDYLLAFLAPSAAGGIVLAVVGWMKASKEQPHIAPAPTVGSNGLAQIAGMVMGQNDLREFSDSLRAIAASHDRCTLMRETEMAARKKEVEETREHEKRLLEERRSHEKRLAEDRHGEHRELVETIQALARSLKDMRCTN